MCQLVNKSNSLELELGYIFGIRIRIRISDKILTNSLANELDICIRIRISLNSNNCLNAKKYLISKINYLKKAFICNGSNQSSFINKSIPTHIFRNAYLLYHRTLT